MAASGPVSSLRPHVGVVRAPLGAVWPSHVGTQLFHGDTNYCVRLLGLP